MIIALKQEDGTVEEISTDDLSAIEAAELEETIGNARGTDRVEWRQVEDMLRGQDPTAMRAVLWIVRRRKKPKLAFGDVDVPGWRRRLTCRIERPEIDDIIENLISEALSSNADAEVDMMLPYLRKLAHDKADVAAALDAVGKGHLVKGRAGSAA